MTKRKPLSSDTRRKLDRIKKCEKCTKYLPLTSWERTKHHLIPLSEGGTNNIKNLQILCVDCHYEEHKTMLSGRGITKLAYKQQG